MLISLVVSDLSDPILGATTALARHLACAFEVEIVGPDLGHGICPMYEDAWDYTRVELPRIYRFPNYVWDMRKLESAVSGEVVIAMKAVGNTVPVAYGKMRKGKKALVYLDEWDGAPMAELPPRRRWAYFLRNIHHPLDTAYYPLVERLIPSLDHVISTSTFLQRKFGGTIVPMGIDCDFFSPSSPDKQRQLRQQLGLEGLNLVVFCGVVRPHKGIECILEALARLNNAHNRFVIVGPHNEHVKALEADPRFAPYITCLGAKPRPEVPPYLSIADMVVLPLNDTLLAQSQTPCKIFEAMAMAKPVIATSVSDLPLILEGCGRVVPPNDVDALAVAIRELIDQPEQARALGAAAREKCIGHYSKEVTERQLVEVIERVLHGAPPSPRLATP